MSLIALFESYLYQQRLTAVVPGWRKKQRGDNSIWQQRVTGVLVLSWAPVSIMATVALLILNGISVLTSVLVPIAALLLTLLLALMIVVVHGKSETEKSSREIGSAFLFVMPGINALGVLIVTLSLECLAIIVATQFVLLAGVVVTYIVIPQLIAVLQFLLMALHILPQAVTSWRFAAPVLFVAVLLSFFTEDIWKIVGILPWPRLFLGAILIVGPSMLFFRKESEDELGSILNEAELQLSKVVSLETTPYFRKAIHEAQISIEEMDYLESEINWKHLDKLVGDCRESMYWRLKRHFWILVAIVVLLLVIVTTVYLFVMSLILVSPSLIWQWLNLTPNSPIAESSLKVSLFLSVFMIAVFVVSAFTDESIRRELLRDLRTATFQWWTAAVSYLAVLHPRYQVWGYRVNRRDILNALLVVPPGAQEHEIEAAVRHMADTCENRQYVQLTAFQQEKDTRVYDLSSPVQRWSFTRYAKTGKEQFTQIPGPSSNDLQYNHDIGRQKVREDSDIPAEWFGNTTAASELGRTIWESDVEHWNILHPFVQIMEDDNPKVFVDIRLKKRQAKPGEYKMMAEDQLKTAVRKFPNAGIIDVTLYYRDSFDPLARLSRFFNDLAQYKHYYEDGKGTSLEPLDPIEAHDSASSD